MAAETQAFVRVHPSGEVFAVTYDVGDGAISGACGPLDFREVAASKLPDYDYNGEVADWLMSEEFAGIGAQQTYSLLDEEQVHAIEVQAAEMPAHGAGRQ